MNSNQDRPFVDQWMWEWGAEFEHSVNRWHLGEQTEAFESWDRLARLPLPPSYLRALEINLALPRP